MNINLNGLIITIAANSLTTADDDSCPSNDSVSVYDLNVNGPNTNTGADTVIAFVSALIKVASIAFIKLIFLALRCILEFSYFYDTQRSEFEVQATQRTFKSVLFWVQEVSLWHHNHTSFKFFYSATSSPLVLGKILLFHLRLSSRSNSHSIQSDLMIKMLIFTFFCIESVNSAIFWLPSGDRTATHSIVWWWYCFHINIYQVTIP